MVYMVIERVNKSHAGGPRHEGRKRIGGQRYNKEYGTRPVFLCRKKPALEQWKALYEVAENLKKLAPWRALSDTDILVLRLPGREEPIYCSVMGHGDVNYGIGVYPGYESYLRLMRIVTRDAYSPELLMLEQD